MSRPPLGEKVGWPYRYQCPDCGSHAVYELIGGTREQGKTYRRDGVGKQRAERDAAKRFRCRVCGERKEGVWDKREERLVRRV